MCGGPGGKGHGMGKVEGGGRRRGGEAGAGDAEGGGGGAGRVCLRLLSKNASRVWDIPPRVWSDSSHSVTRGRGVATIITQPWDVTAHPL